MIISTTITNSRADVIGAALENIRDEVDKCIVVDTGATDDTMQIARDVLGSKFLGAEFRWRDDFAAARNWALAQARLHDADWIVTADTDERLNVPGLRGFLAGAPANADVVMVPHSTGSYRQPRVIRAATKARWRMPVHEYLAPSDPINAPETWNFECIARPNENLAEKYTRYLGTLKDWTTQHPKDPRGWYYFGDTANILGDEAQAINAFERCATLPGWAEQAAWARYRQAVLLLKIGETSKAFEACIRGIVSNKNTGELYWLAGWLCYCQGNFTAARDFARSALVVADTPRVGFSNPRARKALPEELLAFSLAQLGQGA